MFWKDIKKIYKNLTIFYKSSNKKIEKDLKGKIAIVKENPYLYQCIDNNKSNRRFIIQKYIVFYRIENHKVIILRILSHKENYNQKGIYKIKSKNNLNLII